MCQMMSHRRRIAILRRVSRMTRDHDDMLVTTGAQNDRYAKLRNKEKSGVRLRNSENL